MDVLQGQREYIIVHYYSPKIFAPFPLAGHSERKCVSLSLLSGPTIISFEWYIWYSFILVLTFGWFEKRATINQCPLKLSIYHQKDIQSTIHLTLRLPWENLLFSFFSFFFLSFFLFLFLLFRSPPKVKICHYIIYIILYSLYSTVLVWRGSH